MKQDRLTQRVVFFTFSDFFSGASGDAINDKKLFKAIPKDYNKTAIYPKINKDGIIGLNSIINFFKNYLREIITSKKIIITRGGKLAILPILLRKIFRNKIIVRLGCTPLMLVERQAFKKNLEYQETKNILKRIFYFIEPQLEKFALRHADKFIIENNRVRKIIRKYGAEADKMKIVPYYIQDYFLKGENPPFDKNKNFFQIGYTGSFQKYDLLIPIIDSIALLKREKYRVKLNLIGDGPNRNSIENLVNKKNLRENIKFLGSKPHKEVSTLIDNYHCLLLPMLNKVCPSTIAIKVLEGIMKGKIIITTNSGNNPSLFLNNRDLILNTTKKEEIAEKIQSVIEYYEKYIKIAEEIKNYHLNIRSKENYRQKIRELFSSISKS